MEMPAKQMTKERMKNNTHFSKQYVEAVLKQATQILEDSSKKERIAKSLCKACFYRGGRVGGAAITERPCMSCGETQVYGSTATDALCLDCAKEHSLCKNCGGDREMRERRKDWPGPNIR